LRAPSRFNESQRGVGAAVSAISPVSAVSAVSAISTVPSVSAELRMLRPGAVWLRKVRACHPKARAAGTTGRANETD